MPPKLKHTRANVRPEFIELMVAMYSEWIRLNEGMIREGARNPGFAHFAHSARRMLPIIRRQSNDRAGLDYELTRLRGLRYTDFMVVTDVDPTHRIGQPQWDEDPDEFYARAFASTPKIPWLLGRTQFVVMTNYANRREVKGYLGCFDVYIPSSIIRHPQIDTIHMIPHRNQRSIYRHPHHYLDTNVEDIRRRSPLSYPTRNCYGDYAGVIKGLIDEPDFPELFRQLFGHLSTYGYGPPITLGSLDYDINTPEK